MEFKWIHMHANYIRQWLNGGELSTVPLETSHVYHPESSAFVGLMKRAPSWRTRVLVCSQVSLEISTPLYSHLWVMFDGCAFASHGNSATFVSVTVMFFGWLIIRAAPAMMTRDLASIVPCELRAIHWYKPVSLSLTLTIRSWCSLICSGESSPVDSITALSFSQVTVGVGVPVQFP